MSWWVLGLGSAQRSLAGTKPGLDGPVHGRLWVWQPLRGTETQNVAEAGGSTRAPGQPPRWMLVLALPVRKTPEADGSNPAPNDFFPGAPDD